MSTESSHRMNRGAHGDLLSEHSNRFRAIDELSTKRSWRLEANDQNSCVPYGKILTQVMHYSTAGAHACTCHNQAWSLHFIQSPGVARLWTSPSTLKISSQFTRAHHILRFRIEEFIVPLIDLRCLYGHGTVEIDRKRL